MDQYKRLVAGDLGGSSFDYRSVGFRRSFRKIKYSKYEQPTKNHTLEYSISHHGRGGYLEVGRIVSEISLKWDDGSGWLCLL